jgi:hypothetical protein
MIPELTVAGAFRRPIGEARWRDDAVTWTAAASLLLHALVFAATMVWRTAPITIPLPVNIPVELLSPEQYDAATRPAATPANIPVRPGDIAPQDGMVHATAMLSAAALADPKSRQAREMLPHFDPTERSVQLCNLEAMEQVRAWKPSLDPERIVAYATANLAIAGNAIRADGAAFLSGGAWYTLRFDCGLSADHASVVSFDFKVGDTIPRDQWDAHSLPTAN